MPVRTMDSGAGPAAGDAVAAPPRRRFGWLALGAAVYTYALIVFGGIVRITGSGMGCGDDWPRCNGQWIPAFEFATLIEWSHRLLAAGLSFVILAVVVTALRRRHEPGFGGPGGLTRPALAAAGLLLVQVLLGAVTVWLELPASTTVLHFATAMVLLATLIAAAARAHGWGARPMPGAGAAPRGARRSARAAIAAAVIGFVAIVFGGVTANTGAAPLCQGFPLCNGELLPAGGSLVQIHWTHRLLAFFLFFHVVGATIAAWRRGAQSAVVRGAAASLALIAAQLTVAAALVLMSLPPSLQSIHLAFGAAIWGALVAWTAAARAAARATGAAPDERAQVAASLDRTARA